MIFKMNQLRMHSKFWGPFNFKIYGSRVSFIAIPLNALELQNSCSRGGKLRNLVHAPDPKLLTTPQKNSAGIFSTDL